MTAREHTILEMVKAFYEAVKEADILGVPAGHLYAACMGTLTIDQFYALMGVLVKAGKVRHENNCYYAVM